MIFIRFYRVHSHSKCIFILIILLLGVFLLQTSILTRNGRKRDSEIYNNEGFIDIINSRAALMNFICNTKYFPFGKKGNQLNNGLRRFPVSTYWLKNENVAYCPVFKSATTTWRNHLIDLLNQTHVSKKEKQNKKERIQLHQQLLDLGAVNPSTVDWTRYINALPLHNNFTGFIVVRHPFERLVSAFRDKLERNNLEEPFYYRKFGKYFVDKYRKRAIDALGKDYFTEENNFGTPLKVLDNRRPNADLPSFWEFAQSVIERYKIDEHWMPINEFCSVCNRITLKAFHYILKFEELEREESAFIKHCNWKLSNYKGFKLNNNHPDEIPGDELTQIYFSILSKEQIKSLHEMYEPDFLLFNYTFQIDDLVFPPIESNMEIDM